MLELPVSLLKTLAGPLTVVSNLTARSLTLTDSTAGDTVLSVPQSTYLALDGTAIGSVAPTRGLRYNSVGGSVDFLTANGTIFQLGDVTFQCLFNSPVVLGNNTNGGVRIAGSNGPANATIAVTGGAAVGVSLQGQVADSATATGIVLNNTVTLANAGARLLLIQNNGTAKMGWDPNGKIIAPTGGAAAVVGTSTLIAGTVTVSNTAVSAASVILISRNTAGGTVGDLRLGTITAGTSFVINSASGTDTSTVNWWIVN